MMMKGEDDKFVIILKLNRKIFQNKEEDNFTAIPCVE